MNTTVTERHRNGTSARLVVTARVILLLAAAALATAGFALAWRGHATTAAAIESYGCPMHPQVTAAAPAQCSICKMDLEPLDEPVTQKVNLEKPKLLPPSIVPIDPSIYGPGVPWLPETFPPAEPGKPQDGPPVGAVKRRVFVDDVRAAAWLERPDRLAAVLYRDELIGLSAGERGKFFRAAAPRVGIDVRMSQQAPEAWDSATSLVRFTVEPGKANDPDAHGFAAEALEARSGDVGWLELPDKSRELLVFPESALLRSTEGPYVLVPAPHEHTFLRRAVEIGRILDGQVVVLSGLREGDRLVIGKAFFLDAEARLAAHAEPAAEVRP